MLTIESGQLGRPARRAGCSRRPWPLSLGGHCMMCPGLSAAVSLTSTPDALEAGWADALSFDDTRRLGLFRIPAPTGRTSSSLADGDPSGVNIAWQCYQQLRSI